MFNFDPTNHYWIRESGVSVYSSLRQAEVGISDTVYTAWLSLDNTPTAYPKDASGSESIEELAAVLIQYDLYVSKEDEVRARRDTLLQISDWTQTVDSPLTASTKYTWQVYRQKLRDISDQTGFPNAVVWPEVPNISSDSDLFAAKNSEAVEEMSKEETLDEIAILTDSLEDGTEKETLTALLTVLRS